LKYRKFDKTYTDYIARGVRPGDRPLRGHEPGQPYRNDLPITVLAEDSVVFPVAGVTLDAPNPASSVPAWERWNDYGIGLFLKGKAELRQAAEAFAEVEKLERYDGPLNQARVLHREGRIDEAVAAVKRAAAYRDPPPPTWTLGWLSGLLDREQGHLEEAERNLRGVLETTTSEMRERGFDFSLDIEVINLLGLTLFDRANQEIGPRRREARDRFLREAVQQFERTLTIDSEDVTAHYNLQLIYGKLGEKDKQETHQRLHARYKPDDNARDRAYALARQRYPAANHAAEALVIYPLDRSATAASEVATSDVSERSPARAAALSPVQEVADE
jgi:tetratricopeptide (TPR) repeat protein